MNALFNFPKFLEDVVGAIKIVESNIVDGLERKSGGTSQQSGLSRNMSRGKDLECLQEIWIIIPTQRGSQRYNFQQGWHLKGGKSPKV